MQGLAALSYAYRYDFALASLEECLMREYVLDIRADNMLADTCRSYIESGKMGSAFEVRGDEVGFSLAELADVQPMNLDALVNDWPDEIEEQQELDEFGLPKPRDFDGPYFTALNYYSEEYGQGDGMDEAVELRGFEAFLDKAEPSDFSDDVHGVYKVGLAQLWSQSTWENGFTDRDVEREQAALSIERGDLLTIRPLEVNPKQADGHDPLEVRDLGFAFFRGDTMLPYTPYHDYDQYLIAGALLTLNRGELVACLVRNNSCTGGDGVPVDKDFCWRVYTPTVEVLKLGATV